MNDVLVTDTIDPRTRTFIESCDHFFLATASPDGKPTVGYKGGDPGFVKVVDEHTLAFPNYNGNGMYMGMGNLLENPRIGMLFVNWQKGNRVRYHGVASIDFDDPLAPEYFEAQFVVRVRATEIWPNCPRYVHRMERVSSSQFVPKEDCETPVPAWKREDWAIDVLPEGDRALDPDATVL